MYWDDVLKEVLNKNSKNQPVCCARADKRKTTKLKSCTLEAQKIIKSYALGSAYRGVYFTRREAECMLCLLKGKTVNRTAEILSLSPRTVEFYLKNMKGKLNCKTKYELVDTVLTSDFLQGVDFA